jgi:hypothetical protein
MRRSATLAVAAALGCSLAVPARGAGPGTAASLPPEPGTWWDVTTEMALRAPSAPVPARPQVDTRRECLPKKPPDRAPEEHDCQLLDYRRSGARVTFRMKCPDGVTGEADLLWSADVYSGTTIMRGQGMENRITVKGKKIGGSCDANEERRKELAEKEAALRPPSDAGAEQGCALAAESGDVDRFLPPEPGAAAECPDATRFCATLETRRGLVQLRQTGNEDAPRLAGTLCKKDVAAIEKRLCATVAKEPEKKITADEEASEFVFASCPDLAKAMAKRACAGREYSSMPNARREFCTRWAQEALQGR